MDKKIDTAYFIFILSEIMYERGLINEATFCEIKKRLQITNSHISQEQIGRV